MKAAILVLAARSARCLEIALSVYRQAGFDVYVHLDAKVDASVYFKQIETSTINIVEDRKSVFWGGFSMIEAEVALLQAAFKAGSYDRFCLVSDDTFPLKKPKELFNYFDNDLDFIDARKLEINDPFMVRYKQLYFFDSLVTSLHGRPVEVCAIDDRFLSVIETIRCLSEKGKARQDIYYGSQWWSLSRKTAEMLLLSFEQDGHIRESFRFSAVPDEIYFQSLVGSYADKACIRGSSVYVDWTRSPRPFVFNLLTEIPEAALATRAFVRKVNASNEGILSALLRRVEE